MRNFLFGVAITALLALGVKYFIDQSNNSKTELQSSDLILNQIKNVGKLVVTEGHFAEVITYKDNKDFFSGLFTATKKALVVVNASVQVSYDLNKIEYVLDTKNKTVILNKIPSPEININPEINYHNLTADYFNQFDPKDHNLIRKKVVDQLTKKVETSTLVTNAENRLISELQKIYILTNSLGWTLTYNNTIIENQNNIKEILP